MKDRTFLSLSKSRSQSLKINFSNSPPIKPNVTGLNVISNYDLNKLIPFIDWKPFFDVWQLIGKYPNRGYPKIFKDKTVGEEAKKLFDEAQVCICLFVCSI